MPWSAAADGGGLGPPFSGSAVDLACGTGHWARQLAAWGMSVRRYDYAGEAIRQAACRSTGSDTRFETLDLDRQPVPGIRPGSVDLVTCRFAVAYLDWARLMVDVGSWLSWSGVFFVLTRIDEPGALVHEHHRGVSRQQLDQLADGWAHHQIHRVGRRVSALVLRRYTGRTSSSSPVRRPACLPISDVCAGFFGGGVRGVGLAAVLFTHPARSDSDRGDRRQKDRPKDRGRAG
ncbi:hypothetical protein GCM10010277_80390 [Streptomyces longisporoflavus]|uniref:class I SAM-dependent methyltransferase n=1 Tax=Streptomyces longisporoflavus TaxID=28044 RepID=UPI00167DACCA|nr:class I SAM-dependent methyltransferase [Streptomyces longisporoflavus]GGV69896.1 hypothetical protein GCM10010277_80390 [Streptomyces longisporoflavus]